MKLLKANRKNRRRQYDILEKNINYEYDRIVIPLLCGTSVSGFILDWKRDRWKYSSGIYRNDNLCILFSNESSREKIKFDLQKMLTFSKSDTIGEVRIKFKQMFLGSHRYVER